MSSPARAQFERLFATGDAPTVGQSGSFALNVPDGKLWTFDAAGAPVFMSHRLAEFDMGLDYAAGDIVVYASSLWQAEFNVTAGLPFDVSQWASLADSILDGSVELASSGVVSGGVISLTGGNGIAVTSGQGIITIVPTPVDGDGVIWGPLAGAVPASGATVRAVTISTAGALGSVAAAGVRAAYRTHIVLGYVYYNDAGTIVLAQNIPRPAGQTANDLIDFLSAIGGPFKISGCGVSPTGAGTGVLAAGGVVFAQGGLWRTSPTAPNFVTFAGGNPISFDIIESDGGVLASGVTAPQTTVYSGGAVPVGFATIQYLFSTPDGAKKWLQIGNAIYSSLSAAKIALQSNWDTYVPAFPIEFPTIILGAVIALRGATNFNDPAQGEIASTLFGPRYATKFGLNAANVEYLRLDGASVMTGDLDMGGNDVLNAVIDEGVF